MRSRSFPIVLAVFLSALVAAMPLNITLENTRYQWGDTVKVVIMGQPNTAYAVEVRGPNGELLTVIQVTTNSSGVAVVNFTLATGLLPGNYTIHVSGGGEYINATFSITAGRINIRIKGVEVLIQVASKLGERVKCRNDIITNFNITANYPNFTDVVETILNLTEKGDTYLNEATTALNTDNYTLAMVKAVLAIRSYGKVLELQEELAELLNISFAACRAIVVDQPPMRIGERNATAVNETCRWSPEMYPMKAAFEAAEERLEKLEEIAENLQEEGFNVTLILTELSKAENLIEEGERQAKACNTTAAARYLAEARSILGRINAELARIGRERFAQAVRSIYGVNINETEIKEALRSRKILEKITEKLEKIMDKIEEKLEKAEEKIDERIDELEEKLEKLEELAERMNETAKKQMRRMEKAIEHLEKTLERLEKLKERISKQLEKAIEHAEEGLEHAEEHSSEHQEDSGVSHQSENGTEHQSENGMEHAEEERGWQESED